MRIAYVSTDPGVPVFGCKGCSVHVQEVLREFMRRGAEVDLITTRLGGNVPRDLEGLSICKIEMPSSNSQETRAIGVARSNEDISQALALHGPYDFVYERYALYSYAAMVYARSWQTPGILEVNSPLIQEQALHRHLAHRELAEQSTRRAMTLASAVVAVSEQVAEYVRAHRLYSSGIHVIPNGVDPSRFPLPAQASNTSRPFTVGFVGTLKPWHGVSELIEAFRIFHNSISDAQLVIVGDGPERAKLQSQVESYPEEIARSIVFTGSVSPEVVPSVLANWDVAVAPYHQQDGFYFSPLKVFEYMAAGLPTIAGNIGQISELIEHGKSGLLFPPGDIQAIADSLAFLASRREMRIQMGQTARARVLGHHTWKSVVDRVWAIASRPNRQLLNKPIRVRNINSSSYHLHNRSRGRNGQT